MSEQDTEKVYGKSYKDMTFREIQDALQKPVPLDRISYKPQSIQKDKRNQFSAQALPHTDARFFQERLDEVVGPFNWQSASRVESGMLFVGIAIRHPETDEWLWRWDTGQDEAEIGSGAFGGGRGLFSMGFKRAGYQWGIGRSIYAMPSPRVRCRAFENKKGRYVFLAWMDDPATGEIYSDDPGESKPEAASSGPKKSTKRKPTVGEDISQDMTINSTVFFDLAYSKLDMSREDATLLIRDFQDDSKPSGYDFEEAVMALEKNLPASDRALTKIIINRRKRMNEAEV